MCLSPLPHISFIWALASHLFEYKLNPPHNDDNAVMPIVFTRLSRHSVDLLPRNACREDGASDGNRTHVSALARPRTNRCTTPAYGSHTNLRRPYRTFSLHTFFDAVFGKGTNLYESGALSGVRTLDPMIKSHVLYQLS